MVTGEEIEIFFKSYIHGEGKELFDKKEYKQLSFNLALIFVKDVNISNNLKNQYRFKLQKEFFKVLNNYKEN